MSGAHKMNKTAVCLVLILIKRLWDEGACTLASCIDAKSISLREARMLHVI